MKKKLQMSLIILITALLLSASGTSVTTPKDSTPTITLCENSDFWTIKNT